MGAVVKDNKVYGDSTSLQRLSHGGTKQGAGELVPRTARPVGRPSGGPAYRGAPTEGTQPLPQEESALAPLYRDFGRATRTAIAGNLAAQDPLAGPWLRNYKRIAEHQAMQKGQQVRDETPWEV